MLAARPAPRNLRSVTPEDAIGEIEAQKARPVYVVLGEERIFAPTSRPR